MEKTEMTGVEQGFYQKCAELLGVPDTYSPRPYTRVTRWNNRVAGNGRFEGFGLIRMFGGRHVHVSLTHPVRVNTWFTSPEAAVEWLEKNIKSTVLAPS
jgi:hypothetical protein